MICSGCEKHSRTRNSSGSSGLFEEGTAPSTHVYRFVGVEQSLTDARKGVTEERWEDVIAATDALLKQQPQNAEAKAMGQQARLEMPNKIRYDEFMKAAGGNEVAAAMKQYRGIVDGSMYHEKARPEFERLRGTFVENQIGDERALVRAGRCDEARRIARTTGEWFPDARGRLDDAAAGCRQREEKSGEVAQKTDSKKEKETAEAAPAPAASAPIAMNAAAAPTPIGDAPKPSATAAPERTLAAALPAGGSQIVARPPAPAPAAPAAPAPAAAPAAPTRNVPAAELEKFRVSGDKAPSLPAGAKMIAHRDGVKRITMAVKFCVSEAGVPTGATYLKSSDYNDANEQVLAEIRKWRFRPYMIDGHPSPVCTAIMFNYQIQ